MQAQNVVLLIKNSMCFWCGGHYNFFFPEIWLFCVVPALAEDFWGDKEKGMLFAFERYPINVSLIWWYFKKKKKKKKKKKVWSPKWWVKGAWRGEKRLAQAPERWCHQKGINAYITSLVVFAIKWWGVFFIIIIIDFHHGWKGINPNPRALCDHRSVETGLCQLRLAPGLDREKPHYICTQL